MGGKLLTALFASVLMLSFMWWCATDKFSCLGEPCSPREIKINSVCYTHIIVLLSTKQLSIIYCYCFHVCLFSSAFVSPYIYQVEPEQKLTLSLR